MNILFLDWGCFGKADAVFSLQQMGHTIHMFQHSEYIERISPSFDMAIDQFIEEHHIDLCFSFNFYALLSEGAKRHNLKYIAFVYDTPFVMLYSYTIINPNNYVFLFDSKQYHSLKQMGINTVYYSPLPVNGTIIDYLLTQNYNKDKLSADVSFVGALYNEDHNFFSRLDGISDYSKGYLDGIMKAQLKISGYNFIEDVLPKEVLSDIQNIIHYDFEHYGIETPEYIVSNYFINRKLTELERIQLLTAASAHCNLRLYTLNKNAVIPNAENMGAVDYYSEMPYVFHNSKINLNITLRSIQSGIPLRCMDIMGNGGFLLTNYQEDFLKHFTPDVDFAYYEDENDLIHKIDFYLEHEEKRREIAQAGHQQVIKNHSYEKCFTDIFNYIEKDSSHN